MASNKQFFSSKLINPVKSLIALLCLLFAGFALAQEPLLEVKNGDQSRLWTRENLLKHADARDILVTKDVAYQREMHYRAVPFTSLLPQVAQMESVQFIALDGFVANIAGSVLGGKGQAYIAVEPKQGDWPPLDPKNPNKTASAGPFYLVWLSPEKAKIGSEQWPYQIGKISMAAPLQVRFPQLLPKTGTANYQMALRGMRVYLANCAVCHKMNGGGDAQIGPDLNLPMNPTEYFQEQALRKLVRHPSAVRSWPQSQMPGFDEKTVSESQLNELLFYFKAMAASR
jgi:mono/diheme cytochrome c family protein